MVNKGLQLITKRKVERLITGSCRMPVSRIGKELAFLGFVEKGADPISIAFEHNEHELYLEIQLEDRCIHSYLLVTFAEKNKRQRKFRW